MIAESIVAAGKAIGPFKVPVVVRLQGTNSQEGLKMVSSAAMKIIIPSILISDSWRMPT